MLVCKGGTSALSPPQNTNLFMEGDDKRQQSLIGDVAKFVCAVLDLKCNDVLSYGTQTKSFLDLVVSDGEATFANVHGGSPSLAERRASDEKRRMLQSAVDELCMFCEQYHVLLNELNRSYCDGRLSSESVDLHPIVA